MGSFHRQLRRLGAAAFVAGLLCSMPSLAARKPLKVELVCRTLPQVVLCAIHLKTQVVPKAELTWAEASIVKVPDFLSPVRSTVTHRASPSKRPVMYMGLTPIRPGKGEVEIEVRTIVCVEGAESCDHLSHRLRSAVSVAR